MAVSIRWITSNKLHQLETKNAASRLTQQRAEDTTRQVGQIRTHENALEFVIFRGTANVLAIVVGTN